MTWKTPLFFNVYLKHKWWLRHVWGSLSYNLSSQCVERLWNGTEVLNLNVGIWKTPTLYRFSSIIKRVIKEHHGEQNSLTQWKRKRKSQAWSTRQSWVPVVALMPTTRVTLDKPFNLLSLFPCLLNGGNNACLVVVRKLEWWLIHSATHLVHTWPQGRHNPAEKMPGPCSTDHDLRWSSLIPALKSSPLSPTLARCGEGSATWESLPRPMVGCGMFPSVWDKLCHFSSPSQPLSVLRLRILTCLLSSRPSWYLCFSLLCITIK